MGIPSIHESVYFKFNSLELGGFVLLGSGNNSIITTKEINDLVGQNSDVNIVWERYFSNEREIVDAINNEIVCYAKKEMLEIVNPSPYGV